MTRDRQLSLFTAADVRRPVTPETLRLARRVARRVAARGPLTEAELAELLGCGDRAALKLAIGIAVQWRRVARRGGLVEAVHREEGTG